MVQSLQRHKLKPTYAAGLVVLGLLALMTVVLVATVQGVTEQTDQISASVNAAIKEASDSLSVDQATLDSARDFDRECRTRPSARASSPSSSRASTRPWN